MHAFLPTFLAFRYEAGCPLGSWLTNKSAGGNMRDSVVSQPLASP